MIYKVYIPSMTRYTVAWEVDVKIPAEPTGYRSVKEYMLLDGSCLPILYVEIVHVLGEALDEVREKYPEEFI